MRKSIMAKKRSRKRGLHTVATSIAASASRNGKKDTKRSRRRDTKEGVNKQSLLSSEARIVNEGTNYSS